MQRSSVASARGASLAPRRAGLIADAARAPLLGARLASSVAAPRGAALRAAQTAAAASAAAPATLPGAPAPGAGFPIAADRLVELARAAFATQTGIDDESVLADDFRFEFPVISLARADYLKAVRGFSLKTAIPDLNPHVYGFQADPYEPNRV